MITATILMLLPAIQVGIAVAGLVLGSYVVGSCLVNHFTHKSCS